MLDLRERTQSLSAIAGYFAFYGVGDNLLSGRGEPERLSGVPVSENFFDVLGVKPMLGRAFNAQESALERAEGGDARPRRSGSAASTATRRSSARSLTINDEPHTVVGVLPASFDFATVFAPGSRFDLYFPFPLSPETNRWGNTMAMIGRLKPGVTAAQAQAEIRTLAQQITARASGAQQLRGLRQAAVRAGQRQHPPRRAGCSPARSAMVMLIVCANLSNLLLARTAARQKEIAIRMALGAGRRRLLAQMLTEGLVLSCSGAVLGLVLAFGGTRAAGAARRRQHPAAARRAHRRHGARLHGGHRARHRHRLRPGAGAAGVAARR